MSARKFKNDLTADFVRSQVQYDPETGLFFRGGVRQGFVNKKTGYENISVCGKTYLAHRLAWLCVYGAWPSDCIDHIDGNQRNNAITNLREASSIQNGQNRVCKGYHLSDGKYRAQITVHKKRIYLGFYETAEDARRAYEDAALKYFGEFSSLISRIPT